MPLPRTESSKITEPSKIYAKPRRIRVQLLLIAIPFLGLGVSLSQTNTPRGMSLGSQKSSKKSTGPWEMEHSGTTAGLRGVYAVGGGVVWASGADGTVLRSEDTGFVWQTCAIPAGGEKLDFRGIWARDGQTAIVMSSGPGAQSRLYKTTDGCASWQLLFANPDSANENHSSGFWDGILFIDEDHGIVYGDPVHSPHSTSGAATFALEVTNDRGQDWIPVHDVSRSPGANLVALPEESLFAASNSAMTYKESWIWLGTSGGRVLRRAIHEQDFRPVGIAGQAASKGVFGNGWHSAQTSLASGNGSSGVFSLAFRDQSHGVAVGGDYRKPNDAAGTAAFSSDGGLSWTAAQTSPHGYRSAVAWDSQAKAWVTVGTNGSDISYDDGKTWQPLDDGEWNALSLPWVVGPRGRIGKLVSLGK